MSIELLSTLVEFNEWIWDKTFEMNGELEDNDWAAEQDENIHY